MTDKPRSPNGVIINLCEDAHDTALWVAKQRNLMALERDHTLNTCIVDAA